MYIERRSDHASCGRLQDVKNYRTLFFSPKTWSRSLAGGRADPVEDPPLFSTKLRSEGQEKSFLRPLPPPSPPSRIWIQHWEVVVYGRFQPCGFDGENFGVLEFWIVGRLWEVGEHGGSTKDSSDVKYMKNSYLNCGSG